MITKLIETLTDWMRGQFAAATERAITEGVQQGTRSALLKLTGGQVDPQQLLTVDAEPAERIEAAAPFPPAVLPPLAPADLRGLKRDAIVRLAIERDLIPAEEADRWTVTELREMLLEG
jgi:hypothetical protein